MEEFNSNNDLSGIGHPEHSFPMENISPDLNKGSEVLNDIDKINRQIEDRVKSISDFNSELLNEANQASSSDVLESEESRNDAISNIESELERMHASSENMEDNVMQEGGVSDNVERMDWTESITDNIDSTKEQLEPSLYETVKENVDLGKGNIESDYAEHAAIDDMENISSLHVEDISSAAHHVENVLSPNTTPLPEDNLENILSGQTSSDNAESISAPDNLNGISATENIASICAADNDKSISAAGNSEGMSAAADNSESMSAAADDSESMSAAADDSESMSAAADDSESMSAAADNSESMSAKDIDKSISAVENVESTSDVKNMEGTSAIENAESTSATENLESTCAVDNVETACVERTEDNNVKNVSANMAEANKPYVGAESIEQEKSATEENVKTTGDEGKSKEGDSVKMTEPEKTAEKDEEMQVDMPVIEPSSCDKVVTDSDKSKGEEIDATKKKDVSKKKDQEENINKEVETQVESQSIEPETSMEDTATESDKNKKSEEKDKKSDSVAVSTKEDGGKNIIEDTNKASTNEKDKSTDSQRENTEFVQVNTENEKDVEENEKDESSNRMEYDPIASDGFDPVNSDDREGADEELCIIPDTEREISQAEKDAASSIPPLRDLTEASASDQTDISTADRITSGSSPSPPIVVFKYEKDDKQMCNDCKQQRKVKYYYSDNANLTRYLCDDSCLNSFKNCQEDKVAFNWEEGTLRVKSFSSAAKEPPSLSFIRKCASCKKITNDIENNLTWEIMDFCNEFCLTKYQKEIGSNCSSCRGEVKSNSLGKYCVRFGNDIRQFCTSICLEKYKKGLKVCSYCQQDMSGGPAGFIAPVGDKGQFKDFCSHLCMEKYDIMTNDRPPKVAPGTICSVCKAVKPITIEFELDGCANYFCGEPCFVAFSFVNKISPGKCAMCRRQFSKGTLEKHTMYYDNVQHSFCSNSCENIYIIAHRKIVPCSWCKVKKYNFDMIRRYSKTGPMINMCSVNCLSLYRVSINAVNSRKMVCNFCQKHTQPTYNLMMSDGTLRNFCSYNCVLGFQNQFPKQPITLTSLGESGFPVPTGAAKKNKKHPGGQDTAMTDIPQLPVISNVQSLASTNGNPSPGLPPSLTPINTRSTRSKSSANATSQVNSQPQNMNPQPQVLNSPQIINSFADLPVQVQIKQHFIVRPAPLPEQRNVGTMCYTRKANKATTMKPIMVDEEMQTEEREARKILIPVPVPIYVPTPMHMFSVPTPIPVPFPVPVPVPIFIPTTRNSAAGIMKEIKKIQVKIPTDPYEAELLMMAEMVAGEKKEEVTDSESDVDDTAGPEDSYSPEPVDSSNAFGDDMLQMALKMATELDEPAVDLEGALTANTITAPQDPIPTGGEPHPQEESVDDPPAMHHHMLERSPSVRGRKRGMRTPRGGGAKRGRRMSHHQVDMPLMPHHQVPQTAPPTEPTEKPDANMCLKYTFGVNAWKQWVTTKNTELEKSSRRVKLFKTEILQLTADELNYSLCLFVKEVRKPNGAEYAPDTIYYLCLGIQQYLFENGRIDNIFCDPYYEKFTDCLDEVAKKFSVLYNDSHYIVTRVEEEHLWESKQLGAHSPHVLLSTLMFFNTKHFNLTSVDEHMQLSFSHIMKHWKRNPNQPGASKVPGSRNVLLRFYPPQSAIQNNTRKKKVYEQQENEENPLRCPVKLYEFYLSKCPESVKTRNDVFYLQPERSCVPDSPVWYSTMPLPREALEKMLHRVKMVKEINVALLTS